MTIQPRLFPIFALLFACSTYGQQSIPPGTIIPVQLNGTLSSKKARHDKAISARVMQDVPLPGGKKIHEGTKITGWVNEVRPAVHGVGASISFVPDRVLVSKPGLAVTTDLRALASAAQVEMAFTPQLGMGEGDSWSSRTTVQVGGDVVYWGGGPVVGRTGPIGTPLLGADSGVLARVTENPSGGCRGAIDKTQEPQALWVFSSDACGVYGLNGISIAHAGRTEPIGVIELTSKNGEIKVPAGSGMALRVIGVPKS